MNRGIAYLQLGRYDEARHDYDYMAKNYPLMHQVHYGLGEIAIHKKNTSDAIRHFERYLRLAPPDTEEYTNVVQRVRDLKTGKP